ncbi:MAG: nucleotide exchange factor GrpE [Clostridia bacterium]|nr:nucleotide exchange factor GrpE [Clostridia bacterium]
MSENKANFDENVETPAQNEEIKDTPAEEKPKKEKKDKTKAELADAREALAKAEAELAEQKDKYLRMMAEYDNFRRRSQKEKDGIYSDAVSDVISAMLPVVDNLERASVACAGEDNAVAKGLEMTLRSLAEMLEKLQVTSFGEAGDIFDPNVHNAVMHDEDETKKEGEITDVFQKGYRRGDKILRYAMVKTVN